MRSTLDELKRELAELRNFVASIKPVNDVLSGHDQSIFQQFISIRRRFDNAAVAVALYASFEAFVETLAASFASQEAQRLPYAELPPRLTKKHLERSADLLARGRLGEGRHASLKAEHVVENLLHCLTGKNPYALNEAAVVWHDKNFRAQEVDTVFTDVGIEQICGRIRKCDELVAWFMTAQAIDQAPRDGVTRTVIDERLNDLVERRNQIAHRGGNPDDLLSVESMMEAIAFIEALSSSVFSVVVARYLETRYNGTNKSSLLELKEGPYKDGFVVVIKTPVIPIAVGQPLFATNQNSVAKWGRVESIQLNDTSVEHIDASVEATHGIGLRLSFPCPSGAQLVALHGEDDLIWPPLTSAAQPH